MDDELDNEAAEAVDISTWMREGRMCWEYLHKEIFLDYLRYSPAFLYEPIEMVINLEWMNPKTKTFDRVINKVQKKHQHDEWLVCHLLVYLDKCHPILKRLLEMGLIVPEYAAFRSSRKLSLISDVFCKDFPGEAGCSLEKVYPATFFRLKMVELNEYHKYKLLLLCAIGKDAQRVIGGGESSQVKSSNCDVVVGTDEPPFCNKKPRVSSSHSASLLLPLEVLMIVADYLFVKHVIKGPIETHKGQYRSSKVR